ncbi:MAG: sigma-70 family RNA polymerase sigma factor [Flavobacteriales bacterium]|nr:sigma-70 family RNA polymerase sigma factor [Flavobacteriales bacterium]
MGSDQGFDDRQVALAKSSTEAFGPLYERYFGDVFRFILRRAADRELTADLTQQAFVKAMLSIDRYESRGLPFRAWLYRIALNELRMHWRKRKEVLIDMSTKQVKGMVAEMELLLDPSDMERVAQALSGLEEARAQLIHLRFMDGLSYQEVGEVLGIGEDAAKMRTHRTLNALRSYLAPKA